MRSSLLASAAVLATLTSAFAPSLADACGGYMGDPLPAVFAVDDHQPHGPVGTSSQRRSFVMLGGATAAADVAWTSLAPGSYDPALIADLPVAARSATFTLVGPSGARVVSTNRRALVSQTFRNPGPQSALEINDDGRSQFRIAVVGTRPDARWLEAASVETTKQNRTWIKQQGLDATYVYVTKLAGTTIQVITGHQPNDIGLTSLVVVDGTLNGAYPGTAIGGLVIEKKRYVLFEQGGMITPVEV